jgi:TonB-linked SusC/RagA family outer membrane protein
MRKRRKIWSLLLLIGVLLAHLGYAQTRPITGRVVEKDGKALEGATIKVEGKPISTATKADGSFSINAPVGSEIVVSHVGFKAKKMKITATTAVYEFSLDDDVSLIDEVVVTAIGTTTKKREEGYASTTIKSAELDESKPTVVASALQGKVAGLEVNATDGGVVPTFKVMLRGQRSITGNNEALILLDNVVVPDAVMASINPDDIENVTVLNGASATALYGSQAANGALVITTKKGHNGSVQITAQNTTTAAKVSYNPKEQHSFGSGGDGYGLTTDGQGVYSPIENESYGPRFTGAPINLGDPLEDGSQLVVPYSYFKDRNKFWNTGLTNQTGLSLSSGDDKSSIYMSGQYLTATGVTWLDKYTRAAFRINGMRKISKTITANYGISYTQNRSNLALDQTNGTPAPGTNPASGIYTNFLNMPGEVPITMYKNWKTNKFANPDGYYNPWYISPYWDIENERDITSNDTWTADAELKWAPTSFLTFTNRTGLTVQSIHEQQSVNPFTYTAYAISESGGAKSNQPGSFYSKDEYLQHLNEDLIAEFKQNVGNFSLYALGGAALWQDKETLTAGSVAGTVDSGLYNLANTYGYPTGLGNALYQDHNIGAYYQAKIGYKDWIYLNTTGRNDVVSVLAANNRSFFYPNVDLSFVATDAITALKSVRWLDALKFRASWAKVGEVNLNSATAPFGAYQLSEVFGQSYGYPYNGVAGFNVGTTITNPELKPEFTKSWEFGTDFSLFQDRIDGSATYFTTHSTNQTINTSLSYATGFSNLLTNAGETSSEGVELRLNLTLLRNKNWTVSLNSTGTLYNNKIVSLPSTLSQLNLGGSITGDAYSNAVPGKQFPAIYGTDYNRDGQGRVIVDANTGYPTINPNTVYLGNANTRNMVGLSPTVRWKNLTIAAVFEYRGGMKRFNDIGWNLDWSGMGIRSAEYNRQRFIFPNSVISNGQGGYVKNTNVTIAQGGGNDGFWTSSQEQSVATNYMTNGSYWKFRTLSIAYSLPKSLCNAIGAIKSATISAQGRNLFIWLPKSNVYTDPEYSNSGQNNAVGITGYQAPPQRFFGGTLSVTF